MDIYEEMNNLDYQEKFNLFLKIVNVKVNNIYDNQTRNRLIDICEEYYDGNNKEISFLEEFSHSYKSEQAISWYLRESCLHRLLSHAFIDYDMNLLVDMYSFIVDINRNLKQQCTKQQSSSLRVFRSQFISNEKFNLLKSNIDRIITMQCFFSAQTSRDKTFQLLQSIEPNEITDKRILFEIDVSQDYTIVDSSQSSTSKTVLFMLGTTFKIIEVTETTVLLSQYTSSLNGNDDLANESALIIRGILTYLKDGTREAIKYFEEILRNQSSINLATYSSIYGQLAYLKQKSGNLAAATKMYEQAMNYGTMQFGLYLFYLEQAAQYHAKTLGDWEKASVLWLQKLNIQNTFLSKEETAQTYENLAHAALKTKQPAKIIEYTLAAIENLPNDHPHLPFLHQQLDSARKNSSEEISIDKKMQ
jgi:tetratricopeptide (TPR) repeat protein